MSVACLEGSIGGGQLIQTVYDRGVADGGAHQRVDPKIYSSPGVGLPAPEEIPGCTLEVQNYHIPPVGSFHQKTVIVDREVALLSSNNVQNRVSRHGWRGAPVAVEIAKTRVAASTALTVAG